MKKNSQKRTKSWERTLLSLAVASCFTTKAAVAAGPVLPTGPTVINGQVYFNYNGNLLQITNTPGAIINWQGFSIGASEITRFIQQSASSTVLNRVAAGNPSLILGALQSQLANGATGGRVFLINPSGVVFGAGAQINTGGLVVSTLGLSDADFKAGRNRFTEVQGAGEIVNNGKITTPTGGSIYLIAPSVTNSGIIQSDGGEIILAAGKSVDIVNSNSPDLRVTITAPDNQAVNLGQIIAQGGSIGIYGGLVKQGGVVNANTAVRGENGKIVFKATKDVTLDAGSRTTASGPTAGTIAIQSDSGKATVAGTVEANATQGKGGTITVAAPQGVTVETTGSIAANGVDGGIVALTSSAGSVAVAGTVSANATTGRAGAVALTAATNATLASTGVLSASGGQGAGNISIKGSNNVALDTGSKVIASGAAGGTVTVQSDQGPAVAQGTIDATGLDGAGGNVQITALSYITLDDASQILVGGLTGGVVKVQSTDGALLASGLIDGQGGDGPGGQVWLLAPRVGLIRESVVNVSGRTGGGTALVGGDFQGKNPDIQNAWRTYFGTDAIVRADAIQSGDGGKVIVWSDDITRFYGTISARGGSQSGNGGFVEVSGHRLLNFHGAVDLSAAHGVGGDLLLDPLDITISSAAASNVTGFNPPGDQTEAFADDAGLASNFDVTAGTGSFANVAAGTTITLQATNNITVANNFDLATATGKANVSLVMQANNDIAINANLSATGTGTISLTADADLSGVGAITRGAIGNTISQAAGTLTLNAGSGITATTSAPTISFTNYTGSNVVISNSLAGGVTFSGSNNAVGGGITLSEALGNLTVGAGGIVTAAATNSGSISLTAVASGVVLSGNVSTGNALIPDAGGNETPSSGAITVSAASGSISGSGQLTTGNAALTSSGAGVDTATSGTISLTAGAGGVNLAGASALTVGTASVVDAGDAATAGNVSITSGGAVNSSGSPLQVQIGLATGSATPVQGKLSASASTAAAGIFSTSVAPLTLGAITTSGGNVSIATTGAGALLTATANIDTTNSGGTPAGASITLTADDMDLSALAANSIKAGAGANTVILKPTAVNRSINITNGVVGGLDLSLVELKTVSVAGGTLQLGSTGATGDINLNATVATTDVNAGTFRLLSGHDVNITGGNDIGASGAEFNHHLNLTAAGSVNITNGNVYLADNKNLTVAATGSVNIGGDTVQVGSTVGNTGFMSITGQNISLGSSGGPEIIAVTGSGAQTFTANGAGGTGHIDITNSAISTVSITTDSGTQTFDTTPSTGGNGNLIITSSNAGGVNGNVLVKSATGAQSITLNGGLTVQTGGASSSASASAALSSDSGQTITAKFVEVIGQGAALATINNDTTLAVSTNQTITVTGVNGSGESIVVKALGAGGAILQNGIAASMGQQNITVNGSGANVLRVIGTSGDATIIANGTGSQQNISVKTGTSNTIEIGDVATGSTTGVSKISGNNQSITAGVSLDVGAISIRGGTGDSKNSFIINNSGAQSVVTTGDITTRGGTAATTGSAAQLLNAGNGLQTVTANNISLFGGATGIFNSTTIRATGTGGQTITANNNLTLTGGGTTGADLADGASIGANTNATSTFNITGTTTLNGSTGGGTSGTTGSGVLLGSGSGNNVTIVLNGTGDITLNGGAVANNGSAIGAGSVAAPVTTNVTINGQGNVTLNGGVAAGTRIGSPSGQVGGGTISVTTSGVGKNIALNVSGATSGKIITTGSVSLQATHAGGTGGNITEGSAPAQIVGDGTTNPSLTVTADAGISLTGNNEISSIAITNNTSGAVSLTNTKPLVIAAGNITNTGRDVTLTNSAAVTDTGHISAGGLELLGSGPYTLDNASNSVSKLAANTTGAVTFVNAGAFAINTVGGTSSIITNGNDVSLTAGGTISSTATHDIDTHNAAGAGGNVTLTVSGAGNGVNLGGDIVTTGTGSGAGGKGGAVLVDVVDGNIVATGINTTGGTAAGGGAAAQGGTGGDVTLRVTAANSVLRSITANGAVVSKGGVGSASSTTNTGGMGGTGGLVKMIVTGGFGGSVSVAASGSIDTGGGQGGAGARAIDAGGIGGAAGQIQLTANGALHTVTASNFLQAIGGQGGASGASATNASGGIGGAVTITAPAATLDVVNASGGLAGTGGSGGNLGTGSGIVVSASAGNIVFNNAVTTNGANIQLSTPGTATQAGAGVITASGLELLGAGGTYTLTNANNSVTVIAASAGAVNYTNKGNLTVSSINATTGITSSGAVTLTAQGTAGADLTISQPIVAVGTATLNANNSVLLNAASADLSSGGGALAVTLNSDFDGSGAGAIRMDAGSSIVSSGGAVVLGGGNVNPALNPAIGTATDTAGVSLNGASISSGAGNVSLRGTSSAGLSNQYGISIVNSSVTSSTGTITAVGTSIGTVTANHGVFFDGSGIVGATSSGNLNVNGIAGTGGSGIFSNNTGANVIGNATMTGDITLRADSIDITNNMSVLTAAAGGTRNVYLLPNTVGGVVAVDIGGPDTLNVLGLTLSELLNISTNVNRIVVGEDATPTVTAGAITTAASGGVNIGGRNLTLSGTSITAGANTLTTVGNLTLKSTGTVQGNAGAGVDFAAGSLRVNAVGGIGTIGTPLQTQVTDLAFANVTSGDVVVSNTGALTVNSVNGLLTSANTGGKVTLTALGPVTFAVNTTASGDLSATATETVGIVDHVTVNDGVTVRSTAGDVVLRAGDSVVLQNTGTGSTVQSDTGAVTLNSGFGDTDSTGALNLGGGTVNAVTALTLTSGVAGQDIVLGLLSLPAGTITINSSGGIVDGNGGTNNINALTASLIAVSGIGSADPIETTVTNISINNSTSNATQVANTGSLNVTALTVPTNNNLTLTSSGTLALPATAISTGAGSIDLESNGGAFATNGTLTTTSGSIKLLGSSGVTVGHALATGGGAVTVAASGAGGAVNVNQAITTTPATAGAAGGSVIIEAGGAITLAASGAINTSGAANTAAGPGGQGGEVFIHHTNAAAADITLGKTVTAAGGSAAGGGTTGGAGAVVTIVNDDGKILVNAALDASGGAAGSGAAGNGGTIQLTSAKVVSASQTITQSAAITATGATGGFLKVTSSDDVTLQTAGNDVDKVAANITVVGKAFSYTDSNALTVDQVAAAGTLIAPSTASANQALMNGITTKGGVITVSTVAGDVTLSKDIDTTNTVAAGANVALTGASNVTLNAGNIKGGTGGTVTLTGTAGAVSEAGAGVVTASKLEVVAANSSSLNLAGNNVATVAANITGAGNSFTYKNGATVDIGTAGATNGITTKGGVITVAATVGDVTLSKDADTTNTVAAGNNVLLTGATNVTLNAGNIKGGTGGTVTLTGTAGAVSEAGAGVVTANALEVIATNTSSLNNTTNNVATVAANITGAGQAFTYKDATTVDIGTAGGTTGITTKGGVITVATVAGDVTLSKDVDTTNTVAAGANVALTGASNVTLNAGNIKGGTGGTVTLTGTAGAVSEAGAGVVTASKLEVVAANSSSLNLAGNNVATVAANITGAGNSFTYKNGATVDIGTAGATNGITTKGGVITVAATVGDVTLSKDADTTNTVAAGNNVLLTGATNVTLNAGNIKGGTGGTVTLTGTAGAVSEAGAGVVTANALEVIATNTSSLNNTTNNVATVAANITGAGQAFTYKDATTVDIGTAGGTTGITTKGGVITVATVAGDVTLSKDVDTTNTVAAGANVALTGASNVTLNAGNIKGGTGGTVTLTGTAGAVSEAGAGVVTASKLEVVAANSSSLNLAGNNVATVAANITGAGNSFTYKNGATVDIGTAGATNGITTKGGVITVATTVGDVTLSKDADTTNTVAAGNNVLLTGATNVTLNAGNIKGGTGGTVTLTGTAGAVSEAGAGVVTANALEVIATNTSSLNNTTNNVATVAANITGAGQAFTYKDATTVDIGTAGGTTGITTKGGVITVATVAGDVTLSKDVDTTNTVAAGANVALTGASNVTLNAGNIKGGTGGTVTLTGTAGAVSEAGAGVVTASKLEVVAANSSSLNLAGNNVATVAANITGAGNSFTYKNGATVDIGTAGATNGITTKGGVITVAATVGDVTLSKDVDTTNTVAAGNNVLLTGATNVTLNAGNIKGGTGGTVTLTGTAGAVSEAGAGVVTANALEVIATNTSSLNNTTNNVATVAANITGAGQAFTYKDATTVDIGTAGATNGITTNGGDITITAVAGTITQSAALSGNLLTTGSVGGTILNGANTVSSFNATNTGGGAIQLTNGANLVITGVSQLGGGGVTVVNTGTLDTGGAITTAANGNISLSSTDDMTIAHNVTAGGSGTIALTVTTNDKTLKHTANTISSTTGLITLTADKMDLSVGSIGTGTPGGVTLLTFQATDAIDVGSAGSAAANTLELSNAELSTITTSGTLTIGSGANTGGITVSAPLNLTNPKSLALTTGGTLVVNSGSNIVLNTAGGSASFTGVGGISTAGNVTTNNGNVTYASATTLTGPITIDAGLGNISFNSTLDGGFDLVANSSGVTAFNNQVGNAIPLTSITTDLGVAGNTQINTTLVKTTGLQTYLDPVVLGSNTALTSTGSGNVTFNNTLDGGFTLAVNTSGNTVFNNQVGNAIPLTSITTDLGVAGNTQINTTLVKTTGLQTYLDPVVLGSNTALTSTGSGNVTFNNTLDGGFTLAVNTSGNTVFNNQVGNAIPLTSITTDLGVAGNTQINTTLVKTTGLQTYLDPVVLGSNTALTSTGSGNVTFNNTLDGGFTLAVNTSGNTVFNNQVGNAIPLTSITTDLGVAGNTQINTTLVKTTGLQTYLDPVVLGSNTALTSTGSGNVTFNNTLDGGCTLAVNTSGNTVFNNQVGNAIPLTSITTDLGVAGNTQINTTLVKTTGLQTYLDPVVLGSNTALTSTGSGNVTFNNTLDGGFTLAVNTSGNTVFNNQVGNAIPLTSITTDLGVAGNTQINTTLVKTTGLQTYLDPVVLGSNTALTSTGSGNVTFNNTLDGGFTLAVNTAGTTTFNSTVGSGTALASLTTDSGGTTHVNGGLVKTIGSQTYGDAVILGAPTTFNVTGAASAVVFNNALSAAGNALTITADEIDFNGGVNSVSGSNTLVLQPNNINAGINIGTAASGNPGLLDGILDLSVTDIAALKAGFTGAPRPITIGQNAGTHTITIGTATFKDSILIQAPAGAGNVQWAGGTPILSAPNIDINVPGLINGGGIINASPAGSLTIIQSGGIGTLAVPLQTDITNLTAANSVSGDVNINNLGNINIIGQLSNSAPGGEVRLSTTNGSINTGTAAVTSNGGRIALIANDTGVAGGANVTVGAGGTFCSNFNGAICTGIGGPISLYAADNVTTNGMVLSGGGAIQVIAGTASGINTADASFTGTNPRAPTETVQDDNGLITINAPMNAGLGSVTLVSATTNGTNIIPGITQGANGAITSLGLNAITLHGLGGQGGGGASIILNTAVPPNTVGLISLFACPEKGCPDSGAIPSKPFNTAPFIVNTGSINPVTPLTDPNNRNYADGPLFYTDTGGSNVSGVGTVNDFTFFTPGNVTITGPGLAARNLTLQAQGTIDFTGFAGISNAAINGGNAGGSLNFTAGSFGAGGDIDFNALGGGSIGTAAQPFNHTLRFLATNNVMIRGGIYMGAGTNFTVSANTGVSMNNNTINPSASGSGDIILSGNYDVHTLGDATFIGRNFTICGVGGAGVCAIGGPNQIAVGENLVAGGNVNLLMTGNINVTAGTASAASAGAALINGTNINIGGSIQNVTLTAGNDGGFNKAADAKLQATNDVVVTLAGDLSMTGGVAAGTGTTNTAIVAGNNLNVTMTGGNIVMTGAANGSSTMSGSNVTLTSVNDITMKSGNYAGQSADATIQAANNVILNLSGDLTLDAMSGGSNSSAMVSGTNVAVGSAAARTHGIALKGGTSLVTGATSQIFHADAKIIGNGSLSTFLGTGGLNMTGGSATVMAGASASAQATAVAGLKGGTVLLDVNNLGNVVMTGGTSNAQTGLSALNTDLSSDAGVSIVSAASFNPIIAGSLTMNGGTATAGPSNAHAAASALIDGGMDLNLKVGTLTLSAGTATSTGGSGSCAVGGSGGACTNVSALLSSKSGKDLTITTGDVNFTAGAVIASGPSASASAFAGTDAGSVPGTLATLETVNALLGRITLTGGLQNVTGGATANTDAAILSVGGIKITGHGNGTFPGLTLNGATASGLFQNVLSTGTIIRLDGSVPPVTVVGGVAYCPLLVGACSGGTYGSAFSLSGAPPSNLDPLSSALLSSLNTLTSIIKVQSPTVVSGANKPNYCK